MKQYWNEVQPVDSFTITMNGILHSHDLKIITTLYQPLMGPICTSFYITLFNKIENNRIWSEEWNHYHLMNELSINLEEIYHARLKLEGIGLLNTYIKNEEQSRSFIYELNPPLSADEFFSDGMLNIYLYQKLGQSHFSRLKRGLSDNKLDTEQFHNITRDFQDVFESLGASSLTNIDVREVKALEEGKEFFRREKASFIEIAESEFDFDLLFSGLSEVMVPRKLFTKEVRAAIAKLAYLYSINAVDMKKIVLSSLTAEQEIDIDEMRKAARDWFQVEHDGKLPQLVDRTQPVFNRESLQPPVTQEDRLIAYLESISPRQFLIDLGEGTEPSKSDLQAIEEVMFQQKLPPGVINVMIHYVMLKTDMKLSKSYLEKIASHWARKKVTTVKEAMELALKEHRQYQEWANSKKESTQKRKKAIRTEQLPDWFMASQNNQATPAQQEETTTDLAERRRRLEAIQQKYKKNGGEKGGTN
nr:replication initiation and membrane attachment family protein [Paenibacillus bovis]